MPWNRGFTIPCKPPLNPEVTVYTQHETPQESVGRILAGLAARGHLSHLAGDPDPQEERAQSGWLPAAAPYPITFE